MDKSKVTIAKLKQIYSDKGYKMFNENKNYNVNIFGIRHKLAVVDNKFDDLLGIYYGNEGGYVIRLFDATTVAGSYYVLHPCNPAGCGTLVPGQHLGCWHIGLHCNQYRALVQCKPLPVYRKNDKTLIWNLDPATIQIGDWGLDIHHASMKYLASTVDNYSAACQVIDAAEDWNTFFPVIEKSAELYGNSFSYTLLEESDFN